MQIGTTITPERFETLLKEIASECARRNIAPGSVASYADKANNILNNNQIKSEKTITQETFQAIENPMTAINNTDNPQTTNSPIVIEDNTLSELEANLAIYKVIPKQSTSTGCGANCTGLCYTQCTGGCTSGCSGSCGTQCSTNCTGSCSGNCSRGCTGCTGCTSCSGTCYDRCTSCQGCSGCSGCSGCGGLSCSGNCDGNCGVGCSGTCSSCVGHCSGSAARGNDPGS